MHDSRRALLAYQGSCYPLAPFREGHWRHFSICCISFESSAEWSGTNRIFDPFSSPPHEFEILISRYYYLWRDQPNGV